ncbi:MAG: tetratricopeptide repeat protein, partial [Anaerolineales bacterium]|nr:tetratricopeptide repeat protein [Anaerolineales bacterium]
FLLLNRQRPLPRQTVAAQLWPDFPDKEARANLRRHLYELRRVLPQPAGSPWVLTAQGTIQWNENAPYWLDIADFEDLLARQKPGEAIALYEADLLPELFEEWLEPERAALRRRFLTALAQMAYELLQLGQPLAAVNCAQRLCQEEPFDEDAVVLLMQAQFAAGNRSGALQSYIALRTRLQAELAVTPLPATTALYGRIKANEVLDLPATVATPPPSNLPAPLTSFIGRNELLQALSAALSRSEPAGRLWTLTGPGGSGKTRLALEVARQILVQHPGLFRDGIHFVDLATLQEASLVPATIAAQLGFALNEARPLLTQMQEKLRHEQRLILLDNFEQVLTAAPQLLALLQAAPGLRLLVTSRAILNLYGEQEFPVPPLLLPADDQADMQKVPAVALFLARAQAVRPDFTLTEANQIQIATICRQLDGLPLALELAAARLRHHTVAEIAAGVGQNLAFLTGRLQDRPPRQQTMTAAIAWSYDLLPPAGQRLLRRLGQFAGPFDLAAARAIAAEPALTELDLQELAEQSLLQTDRVPGHWVMLATLQQFMHLQLHQEEDLADLAARFWQHYRDLVAQAAAHWHSETELPWRRRLHDQQDNIRAALNWAIQQDHTAAALEMAVGLTNFWSRAGQLHEGRRWLQLLIEGRDSAIPAPLLGQGLRSLGHLTLRQGDYPAASQLYSRALTIYEELGDQHGQMIANINLAICAAERDRPVAARAFNEAALAQARQLGDLPMEANVLHNLFAVILEHEGDLLAANRYGQQALQIWRKLGNEARIAGALNNMGVAQQIQGNTAAAAELFQESLRIRQRLGHELDIAQSECNLALMQHKMGQTAQALAGLGSSLERRYQADYRRGVLECLRSLALVVSALSPASGLKLFAAAEQNRLRLGSAIDRYMRPELARWQNELQSRLIPAEYEQLWRAGGRLQLDNAVSLARQLIAEYVRPADSLDRKAQST